MSWLDPIMLWFKGGVQLPVHRRIALGDGLTMVEDLANDQLVLDTAPVDDSGSIVTPTTAHFDLTRQLGGDLFHGLEFTQFNGTGLTGGEFPTGTAGKLAPWTIMTINLSPDGGGASYHPTLGFGTEGVAPGWMIHLTVRGSSNTTLSIHNGTNAVDPLVDLVSTDYEHTGGGYNPHKRVHSFVFMGSGGSQIDGYLWQRISPYGSPAYV